MNFKKIVLSVQSSLMAGFLSFTGICAAESNSTAKTIEPNAKDDLPTVSVVIPVYNGKDYLDDF